MAGSSFSSLVSALVLGSFLIATISSQAAGGQCLPNGQTCQWDTSVGNCCSTYCYQQVGQASGVCQDRSGSSAGATAQTATAYQTPQRNPATYSQNGQAAYSPGTAGGLQAASGGAGQCLPNGQTCQWDTSIGNCCSTYCYQQAGQASGVCQDRSGGGAVASGPAYSQGAQSQAYLPVQQSSVAYSQPQTASGGYPSSQQAYYTQPQTAQGYSQPGQAYPSAGGQAGCLQNGQSCTYTGSMGNCCSGWCQQLQPQPTGTCAQPGSASGSAAYGQNQGYQPVQQSPAAYSQPQTAPGGYPSAQQAYYTQPQTAQGYSQPGQAYSSVSTSQGSCLQNGQACTYTGSMGNCCSGWCRQMENEATGTCSAKLNAQG